MHYWYPKQSRVDAISAELGRLEKVVAHHAGASVDSLPILSQDLLRARNTEGFPKRQIEQWVWIASQYRIHVGVSDGPANCAGAALLFLAKRLTGRSLQKEDEQDLNWVVDSTVQKLNRLLKPTALRSWLSPEELLDIERQLAEFAAVEAFDVNDIRRRVERSLSELNALATGNFLSALNSKVETLFECSLRKGASSAAAQAALLYLAHKQDAVVDTRGVLGLLDDVYVIDWAYAAVESQTRCLPLLQALLRNWPYVADIALVGSPALPLDRYSQYVTSACLYALFEAKTTSLLIVRETAGFGAVCSFFAAVECARRQGNELEVAVAQWPLGQHVVISDGTVAFKAAFQGVELVGNRKKYKLGVRGNGSMTVGLDVLPYMARAAKPHRSLSSGSDLSIWLKNRHVDPLANLTGSSRRRLQRQESVLLIGPRHKLDTYFSCLKPFGTSAAGLLGARYVTADDRRQDIDGEASESPLIYACSDVDTASDLIRDPPEHVSKWRIIVDGARSGLALLASLRSLGERGAAHVCILAELHDRECSEDLIREGLPVWFLESHDVEPAPLVVPKARSEDDALTRSLRRQGGHWAVATKVDEVECDFLDRVASCLRDRMSANATEMRSLDFAVSTFLQKAISRPVRDRDSERELIAAGRVVASHASVLRQYDSYAARLFDLFKNFETETLLVADKHSRIAAIMKGMPHSQSLAVVCRSLHAAETCKTALSAVGLSNGTVWTNLEGLRRSAPYDNVIVPGWLDRLAMREIANGSYGSHLSFILYGLERRWFETMSNASRRWERRVEEKTVHALRSITPDGLDKAVIGSFWRDQTEQRLKSHTTAPSADETPEKIDIPELEQLEARAIAALQNTLGAGGSGSAVVSAQLVLFDEPGAYAFLPPTGKVIVLSTGDAAIDRSKLAKGDAERLLFRSVASLEIGMVLAFSMGGTRDLVDARADQFIPNAASVRSLAADWKRALQRYLATTGTDHNEFARRMTQAGQRRHPYTVRSWATNTDSIAPRNYRVTVELIAKLTEDLELRQRLPQVLTSIDLIYRARAQAAEAILREIFSGAINLDAPELEFDLNGIKVRYALHRVKSVAGVQEVPLEMVGKIRTLGAPSHEPGPEAVLQL